MGDERETKRGAALGGSAVWVVFDTGRLDPRVIAFWHRADAEAHAASLSPADSQAPAVLIEVAVQGARRRCQLCGEPVVLDDPFDAESWRHADDANDLGDHTAET